MVTANLPPDRSDGCPSAESSVILCQGCAQRQKCRLGLYHEWIDGEEMHGWASLSAEHEGGPGTAHGGSVAALLDELSGHLCRLLGPPAVTASIAVRYRRPVPVGQPLRLHATISESTQRGRTVAAELFLDSTDTILASSTASFVYRRPDHYEKFDAWLTEQGEPPTAGGAPPTEEGRTSLP